MWYLIFRRWLSLNNLKKLRKERKLTLKKVAQDNGIAESQLSFYENGKRQPRDQNVWKKLANYFDVPVAYVMGLTDSSWNDMEDELAMLFNLISDVDIQLQEDTVFALSIVRKDISNLSIMEEEEAIKYYLKILSLVSEVMTASEFGYLIRKKENHSIDFKKYLEIKNDIAMNIDNLFYSLNRIE